MSQQHYTISVRFKDDKERKTMLSFLENHRSLFEKIKQIDLNLPDKTIAVSPCQMKEDNWREECLLTFNCSSLPHCVRDLCAWMAIKSSYRSMSGKAFFYENHHPVVVGNDPQSQLVVKVDGTPFRTYTPPPFTSKLKTKIISVLPFLHRPQESYNYFQLFQQLNQQWMIAQRNLEPRIKIVV